MRVGPYSVTPQTLATLGRCLADSLRVNLLGYPALPGASPADFCRETLRRNARDVLWAGTGHFNYMWVSDFSKSLRGAWGVLGSEYLCAQIDRMLRASAEKGYVPACYSGTASFDVPWRRGDGLPWLFHAFDVRREKTGRGPTDEERSLLQGLLDEYERTHFTGPLIGAHITGDWVDTILRPSSTYNNVCALRMLALAPAFGLKTRVSAEEMEAALIGERLRARGFTDYEGAETLSVDGAVAALYLGLFSQETRERLADGVEALGAAAPLPIRAAAALHQSSQTPILTRFSGGYHQAVWLHLGLMYLNGLKRLGRDVEARKKAVEEVFARHRNAVEAVHPDGRIYRSLFLSCEHGLTMAAGQYLELTAT